MDTLALLRKLSEGNGISGYEDVVRAVVRQVLDLNADEFSVDTVIKVYRDENTPTMKSNHYIPLRELACWHSNIITNTTIS